MFPANQTISPKFPTSFRNLGPRPSPFQAHQPLKMAAICTNNTLKILRFDEVFFLCYGQFYGLLLQNSPIPLPYFRPHSLRIHYAERKRPLGRGALRAQIHPGYGTGAPANPHRQKKNPPAFRLRDLVRVARVELDKLRPIKPFILDGLQLVCTIHSLSPVAASTFSLAAARMRMRNAGTGAPMAAAFSRMLPSSVRMYHTSTIGSSSTV